MKFYVICYALDFVDVQTVYAWLEEVHLTTSGYLKGWADREALDAIQRQNIRYEVLY